MPILIKDYNWNQTLQSIMVQVPLKGACESKVDVVISSRYIKASYEQNFFEAVLFSSINPQASKCTITETGLVFELIKCLETIWDVLEPNISKAEKLELKKQFLQESYEKIQKDFEEKLNKKSELNRVAVRNQIQTDTENRTLLESIKKKEEEMAMGNVDAWTKAIFSKKYVSHKLNKPRQVHKKTDVQSVVLPRVAKTLHVDFTPRQFPTPSRESKLEEETEWLTKQAEARRSSGFISEDIRPEERNPQYLKSKGDEFLKNKNYLGAISAYSYGIKISNKFVDFYIARSEAHLSVGNFHKVLQDCSTALDLLKPECLSNLKERALCIGRRGEALCLLGMKKQGLQELTYSLKLNAKKFPSNTIDIEQLIENEWRKTPSNSQEIKNEEKVNIFSRAGYNF